MTRIRAFATSLSLILIVAFGLRLGYLWDYQHQRPGQTLGVSFLGEAGSIAYSLSIGNGFSSPFRVDTGPTAWLAPVYPLLLAGVFRLFGAYSFHAFLAAALLNILFCTVASIPIYFAGQRIGGLGVGAGAAWIWAVFPNAILIPVESMWDASLAALLVATIFWATLALAEGSRVLYWCGYGLLWGLLLMVNSVAISALPLLLVWLAYRARVEGRSQGHPWKLSWLGGPLLAAMIAALCCVPWTIRNYAVFRSFIPLRSGLGLQLWLGNNPQTGDVRVAPLHPIGNAAERAKYINMGEVAYMREKMRDATAYMLTHPEREAQLFVQRFVTVWAGGTPHPLADFLRYRSLRFRFILLFNIAVAAGTLLGIVVLFQRRSIYAFPTAVFPIVYPWAYYLTLVNPRYRLPIDPIMSLLTAVAIASIGFHAGSVIGPEPSGHTPWSSQLPS